MGQKECNRKNRSAYMNVCLKDRKITVEIVHWSSQACYYPRQGYRALKKQQHVYGVNYVKWPDSFLLMADPERCKSKRTWGSCMWSSQRKFWSHQPYAKQPWPDLPHQLRSANVPGLDILSVQQLVSKPTWCKEPGATLPCLCLGTVVYVCIEHPINSKWNN